jgi:hypothetical protein
MDSNTLYIYMCVCVWFAVTILDMNVKLIIILILSGQPNHHVIHVMQLSTAIKTLRRPLSLPIS